MNLRSVLCLLVLLTTSAAATPVTVSDAWFRALPGGLPGAGYFTLHNGTGHALTLTGAKTAACGDAMLHQSTHMGGMAGMSAAAAIDIPAGGTLRFAPGGYHIMCMSPALKIGTTAIVTLHFGDGSSVTARFAVRGANGK
jgi:copper(I)-binding protein